MEIKSRTLEITILSAEDLRINNKPVKKNAFVVVWTDTCNYKSTKIDADGGSFPSWNDKLVMDMPLHTRFVTLQVKCMASGGGDKTVGVARIPVTDFIGGFYPETCLQFLSYRLRDPKGLKNGIVNVSVRVKEPLQACSSRAAASPIGIPVDGRKDFGVATGIPIWNGYPSSSLLTPFAWN
ncbi:BON1-associated protein 2-like [Hibiscus syriacus]|uniref:BON1-associated protein 2-like n=1 Tax=Hibiscus syriacus TaxID=106335 RepID=A0A6A3BZC4_HIBSY|nr:BON1-associated protein 2-like [Hibiscus syriacus]KAE8721297.1 BON1-associated protein 2-like [Hibiscus syriacus]